MGIDGCHRYSAQSIKQGEAAMGNPERSEHEFVLDIVSLLFSSHRSLNVSLTLKCTNLRRM